MAGLARAGESLLAVLMLKPRVAWEVQPPKIPPRSISAPRSAISDGGEQAQIYLLQVNEAVLVFLCLK